MTVQEMKTPKCDLLSERAVLGCCLFGRNVALRAREVLVAEDFYSEKHRHVFKAACDLLDAGADVDMITVAARLREGDKLGDVGGVAFLNECHLSVAAPDNVGSYAQVVRFCSLDREIERQLIVTGGDKSPESLDKLGDLIYAKKALGVSGFLDFATDIPATLDAHLTDKDNGVPTLLTDIRLYKGDVLAIGARPGVGKTALGTKMMLLIAGMNVPCLYITTEMSKEEMLCRVLPIATDIHASKFTEKKLSSAELRKIGEVTETSLSKLPIKIWAHPSPTIADVQAAVIQSKCRVAFLDYLQRFTFPDLRKQDARTYQITEFMKRLKTFAAQTGTSVVLLCQLDRKFDKEKREPHLSDLADSGSVEKESVSVGFLWHDEKDKVAGASRDKRLRWKTAKNRKGRVGTCINMSFREDFVDMLSELYEAPNEPAPAEDIPDEDDGGADWFNK